MFFQLSFLTPGIDYHHDMLNPSSIPPSEIIKRADVIWKRRSIRPKQHLNEPRPGAVTLMERRAHADRCETLPADLPDDMGKIPFSFFEQCSLIYPFGLDLMIEVDIFFAEPLLVVIS